MSLFTFNPFDSEYGDAYKVLGFSLVLCVFLWFGVVICEDKTPKSYYLESDNNKSITCVYANEKWIVDPTVYCGDVSTAWQVAVHLNESMTALQKQASPMRQQPEVEAQQF